MLRVGWVLGIGGAVAAGLGLAGTGTSGSESAATYAFVGVNVVPMGTEEILEDRVVLVDGDRIVRIGPASEITVPEGALRIEGEGRYLMPGLAEMHAHIPGGNASADYLETTLFLYVANGITTIRGMLGEPAHLDLRERAERGDLLSPRIYTSGPSLNGNSVGSPERAREMVRDQASAGYDFLKLHPGLSRAAFDAIDATADETGLPFAGHVSLAVGLERTLEAEQASIDHLDGYVEAMAPAGSASSQFFGLNLVGMVDLDELDALARATAEAGVWNVPTQALFPEFFTDPSELDGRPDTRYVPQQQVDAWANAVRQQQTSPLFTAENGARFLEIRRRVIAALHEADAGLRHARRAGGVRGSRAQPVRRVAHRHRERGPLLRRRRRAGHRRGRQGRRPRSRARQSA